jgi:hypothetical protein
MMCKLIEHGGGPNADAGSRAGMIASTTMFRYMSRKGRYGGYGGCGDTQLVRKCVRAMDELGNVMKESLVVLWETL